MIFLQTLLILILNKGKLVKTILITNDDGFESPALLALREVLLPLARVIVVAPANERSACGHSLTLTAPLHFVAVGNDFYKLNGTPTDCIYLALHSLFKNKPKPDIIVSGINLGSNMGEDTTYSGTVGAAMEGSIAQIPSLALSQVMNKGHYKGDFSLAKKVAFEIVSLIFAKGFPLPERQFLNINIPDCGIEDFKGYKVCELGYRVYGNDAHLHRNPRGEEHYWLGIHPLEWQQRTDEYNDFKAVAENYVAITPLHIDLTSYNEIQKVREWI